MNEMNNTNLPENAQTPETETQTSKDDRFDYINQKPKYGTKALVFLGAALAVVLCFILGSVYYVSANAYTAISDFLSTDENDSDEEKILAAAGTVSDKTELESTEVLNMLTGSEPAKDSSTNDELVDAEPVYTKEAIALALYEVDRNDNTLVTTSSDEEHAGYYVLKPGTVYAIRWDATPLYRNEDEKVDANIEIGSDFLIGGGTDGEGVITVTIRDYHRQIDYVGELHLDVEDANLGIEFCAKQCQIRAYGFNPAIQDGKFTVCFYTSGEYVESVSSSISSVNGSYRYTYSVDGGAYLNDAVTQPEDNRYDDFPRYTPAERPPITPDSTTITAPESVPEPPESTNDSSNTCEDNMPPQPNL